MLPACLRERKIGLSAGIVAAAAGIVIAAAAAAAIVIDAGCTGKQTACFVALRREKGVNREVEVREDLARVLLTADTAVRAVAPRQTYVVGGHEQLDVALEPDDRELTEGDEQLVAVVAEHQIVAAEARADRAGDFVESAAAAVAADLRRNHAGIQHDRIDNFNDRGRLVAVRPQLHVAAVLDILRGEDAGAAFAAEQHNALVKYRQTIHDTRTTDHAADLALNAVEKADVNRVEPSIKLDAFHVNGNTEQLCFMRLAKLDVIYVRKFWGGW